MSVRVTAEQEKKHQEPRQNSSSEEFLIRRWAEAVRAIALRLKAEPE